MSERRQTLKIEKACNFYPAHATFVDFNLEKTEYRLIAVFGPCTPESHGDNVTIFSDRILEEEVFNTSKHIVAVMYWNI